MSKSRSRRRPGVLLRSQASSAFLVCKYAVSAPRIGGPTGSPSRARCRRGRGHHESAIEYVLFPLHRSLLSADLPPRPPSPPRPATPPARRFTPPPSPDPVSVAFGSSLFGGGFSGGAFGAAASRALSTVQASEFTYSSFWKGVGNVFSCVRVPPTLPSTGFITIKGERDNGSVVFNGSYTFEGTQSG